MTATTQPPYSNMTEKLLSDKSALVSGGARGIGAAIVEQLLQLGAKVTFCGRSPKSALSERSAYLDRLYPGQWQYCNCDISDRSSREQLLDECLRAFGELDILVNNAGVAPEQRADILEATEESYDRVMDINLKGPYFLTQAVARQMCANPKPGRCVITIGSISADTPSTSRGEYCLSKAGLAMLTKLWAVRLAEFNISVFEIQPGIIKTDMTAAVQEKYDRLLADGLTLQRRWGLPEDVAKAVKALVCGLLPYSTGQVIRVDGGMSLPRL